MSSAPIIWVLGGPGCGKGTQCAKIVEKYGFTHLSTGDLLREEVASGTENAKMLEDIMKEGKLVPNEFVLCLLEKAIKSKEREAKGFLIDGYPREKDQGTAFVEKIGRVNLILFFDCKDETMAARIASRAAASDVKRADDNEETIKTRLATFRNNTNAILEQYTTHTVTINAERSVDDIFTDVVSAIECIMASQIKKSQ